MNRFAALAIRFVMIVFGYTCATITASSLGIVLLAGAASLELLDAGYLGKFGLILSAGIGALFVGYYAFLPAMAVIVIAEILGKRDWLFHALGGAGVALVAANLLWDGGGRSEDLETTIILAVAAGICGGITYWFIAGRTSGSWHRRELSDEAISTPPEES